MKRSGLALSTLGLWSALLCGVAMVVGGTGCATYSDKTEQVRSAIDYGDLNTAVQEINTQLEVETADQFPDDWKGNVPLLVLERATVLQALQEYEQSAKNFSAAEQQLEFLDFYNDAGGKIAKYMFSDSATKYKSTATEKLALNGMNMINFLLQGDYEGARVEVKRFNTMAKYLKDYEPDAAHGLFGSYLAGFIFEASGDANRAMRHYDDALAHADFPSLSPALVNLAGKAPVKSKRIQEIVDASGGVSGLAAAATDATDVTDAEVPQEAENPSPYTNPEGAAPEAAAPAAPTQDASMGEVLIVAKVGRVPHKIPIRLPIGAAIGIAGTYITGNPDFLIRSGAKIVIFPGLERNPSKFNKGHVKIAGQTYPMELASNLGVDIEREYEALKPRIVGSAITRMITRAVAAEGTRAATKKAGVLGALAGLAVEGTMAALDKPDTRSWTTLPEKVYVLRARMPAGTHELRIIVSGPGGSEEFASTVELAGGDFQVVDVTSLK